VLLVDDDDPLRAVIARTLRKAEFDVVDVDSGHSAIAQLECGSFDVILSDVYMPEHLFMSGYADNAVVQHGVLDSSVAYLQKPFTPSALLCKVREVLDARA
jgi:CheY-like chemotaxis protein